MDWYVSIVEFFQQGGMFMYPIVLVFAFGFVIMIERWIYLTGAGTSNRRIWAKVMPLVSQGRYREADDLARQSKTAIGSILGYGLDRARSARRRARDRAHGLRLLRPVGLIKAFTAVAAANPAEKADLLSASISVAMNTTAFGLMVAIPLLLAHSWLQTKTTEMVDSLEMASVKFLNTITERAQTQSGAA